MPKIKTDPYGKLEYAVGSSDYLICFDFHVNRKAQTVTLHAVVNCESGHFIEDFIAPFDVSYAGKLLLDPYNIALQMVNNALDVLRENGVNNDKAEEQDPEYFARAVHAAITNTGPAIKKAVEMVRRPLNTGNYL